MRLRGYGRGMESLTCPQCGVEMEQRQLVGASVSQCPDGHGVFLARADLGVLVEAENDWHRNASQQTAPIPRITPDMQTPRPPGSPPAPGSRPSSADLSVPAGQKRATCHFWSPKTHRPVTFGRPEPTDLSPLVAQNPPTRQFWPPDSNRK